MSDFRKFLDEQLEDPEFKAEWDALQPERALVQAMIDARKRTGLTKRLRALQLLHDAGVLPPGKELHALVLQPAAQRPVRAADRNVKDHGSVSFAG